MSILPARTTSGGGYQDLVPGPAQPLGHRIGNASERLAKDLATH